MSRPADMMSTQLGRVNAQLTQKITRFYGYSLIFPSVAALATDTKQLVIQADADFLIQQITAVAIDNVATPPVSVEPLATIQLIDTGSSMNVFDQPIPVVNFAGDGRLPYILSTPLLLMRNAALTGTLINSNTTNAVSYYVTFLGQKIFN